MTTLLCSIALVPAATTSSGAAMVPEESSGRGAVTSALSKQPRPEVCRAAVRAVAYYRAKERRWLAKMGARRQAVAAPSRCPRYLALVARSRAQAARARFERWYEYHYAWQRWLPDKWQRIGACETGYGRRPGQWTWNSGTYQGAFGFYHGSWDAFVPHADPKAGPYPRDAHLATPRQQYEVALAIWRRYGFSGWGCRAA